MIARTTIFRAGVAVLAVCTLSMCIGFSGSIGVDMPVEELVEAGRAHSKPERSQEKLPENVRLDLRFAF